MASTPYPRNGSTPPRQPSNRSTNASPRANADTSPAVLERGANQQPAADSPRRIRIVLPRLLHVEPADLEKFINDDPLVGTLGAAIILGLSVDVVKKWRQRGQGPRYYQYEDRGPVLYSLNALKEYKAAHLVIPRKKGRKQ